MNHLLNHPVHGKAIRNIVAKAEQLAQREGITIHEAAARKVTELCQGSAVRSAVMSLLPEEHQPRRGVITDPHIIAQVVDDF